MSYEPQFTRLRIYNILMGFLHLAQAIFIIILSNDFKLPITTSFLTLQEETGRLWPATDILISLPLGIMVAVFLLLSALAHFSLATFGYKYYVRNLKMHINRARWYEYAFSSSLMIVIIAMLNGMYDLSSLILIFALNGMMILFGYMMELHNQTTERTDWTAFIFGCIAGIVPWITIVIYLVGANQSPDTDVPDFVYGIVYHYYAFFLLQWIYPYALVTVRDRRWLTR